MNDKELLMLAAKAAGIKFELKWYGVDWNPLHDDADAFRLAVKLDIRLRQKFAMVQAEYPWFDDEFNTRKVLCEGVLDDYCAASRRAIVRAAAAIGSKTEARCVSQI